MLTTIMIVVKHDEDEHPERWDYSTLLDMPGPDAFVIDFERDVSAEPTVP